MARRKRKLDQVSQAEMLPLPFDEEWEQAESLSLKIPPARPSTPPPVPTEYPPQTPLKKKTKPPRRQALREKAQREIEAKWSPYQYMWTLVMFDLPFETKEQKRDYVRFRKSLLKMGLTRMQFSIYYRCVPTDEKSKALGRAIKQVLPPHGEVRILAVTARQFEMMEVFFGKKAQQLEKEPEQLLLF